MITALNYCLGFSRCVSLGMERSRRKEDSLQCGINIETGGRRGEEQKALLMNIKIILHTAAARESRETVLQLDTGRVRKQEEKM